MPKLGLDFAFDAPPPGAPVKKHRPCAAGGCDAHADYPAPRHPSRPEERVYFCLEHVVAHNKAWNYYEGMHEREIEQSRRDDVTWNRPSWPLSGRQAPWIDVIRARVHDFAMHGDTADIHINPHPVYPDDVQRALDVFGLDRLPDHQAGLKKVYKALVKIHHPDISGRPEDEEKLKGINLAYKTLQQYMVTNCPEP